MMPKVKRWGGAYSPNCLNWNNERLAQLRYIKKRLSNAEGEFPSDCIIISDVIEEIDKELGK